MSEFNQHYRHAIKELILNFVAFWDHILAIDTAISVGEPVENIFKKIVIIAFWSILDLILHECENINEKLLELLLKGQRNA